MTKIETKVAVIEKANKKNNDVGSYSYYLIKVHTFHLFLFILQKETQQKLEQEMIQKEQTSLPLKRRVGLTTVDKGYSPEKKRNSNSKKSKKIVIEEVPDDTSDEEESSEYAKYLYNQQQEKLKHRQMSLQPSESWSQSMKYNQEHSYAQQAMIPNPRSGMPPQHPNSMRHPMQNQYMPDMSMLSPMTMPMMPSNPSWDPRSGTPLIYPPRQPSKNMQLKAMKFNNAYMNYQGEEEENSMGRRNVY